MQLLANHGSRVTVHDVAADLALSLTPSLSLSLSLALPLATGHSTDQVLRKRIRSVGGRLPRYIGSECVPGRSLQIAS